VKTQPKEVRKVTYEEREQMFAKDYLSIEDIQKLLGMPYQKAADQIRTIKRKFTFNGKGVRLNIQGKIHVEDYLDYFNIDRRERYDFTLTKETKETN
jgi:hypothetical protein